MGAASNMALRFVSNVEISDAHLCTDFAEAKEACHSIVIATNCLHKKLSTCIEIVAFEEILEEASDNIDIHAVAQESKL